MMRRGALWALVVFILTAVTATAAPGPAVLEVKSTLAGVVLADDLAEEGKQVDDAQPLVYVRTTLTGTKAVAARAPIDGVVARVIVKAGQRVERGDVVVLIAPR